MLGVSSKYRPLDPDEKSALLSLILRGRPAFIDTATVYGEGSARINPILGECLGASSPETLIVNKVGANLVDGPDLGKRAVLEFEQSLSELGRVDVTLAHRASEAWIERDLALHAAVRSSRSPVFGICTNSRAVLEVYADRMRLDVLQVAINLLDFQAALPVLQAAKERGIAVMARSALSSGLLGGSYGSGDVDRFTDELRRRYRETPERREIYRKRMEKAAEVSRYHRSLQQSGRFQGSLAAFCYLAIRQSPGVDSLVLGGSTGPQLEENLALRALSLPADVAAEITRTRIAEWAAPYL